MFRIAYVLSIYKSQSPSLSLPPFFKPPCKLLPNIKYQCAIVSFAPSQVQGVHIFILNLIA